jgi:hypothetical protein
LSVMVSVPLRGPPTRGVKVTVIVQEPLAETLLPQSLVWLKSSLMPMRLMVSATLPMLLSVTLCALDAVPTSWPVNISVADESVTAGFVVFNSTEIVPFDWQVGSFPQEFATAKSGLPSPLKSPTATESGRLPTE